MATSISISIHIHTHVPSYSEVHLAAIHTHVAGIISHSTKSGRDTHIGVSPRQVRAMAHCLCMRVMTVDLTYGLWVVGAV